MWFLTHIRRVRTLRRTLYLTLLLISFTLSGCSSVPKFDSTPTVDVTTRSVADIPMPVFDENEAKPPRIASSDLTRGIVSAPKPFAWEELGKSAGDRPVQAISVGQGGYRTLILGSLSGHDPAAINLTEKLAQHIHQNGIILGGIEATIVRNANPDGEAMQKGTNANGVVLNRQFTDRSAVPKPLSAEEPEIRLLRELLNKTRPQRVIHIRTFPGTKGAMAASKGAAATAREVADWLDFDFYSLPEGSRPGTLERYLSEQESQQLITFAFPRETDEEVVWEEFGDSLLNLLLHDDYQTRTLARQQDASSSADRRGIKNSPMPSED